MIRFPEPLQNLLDAYAEFHKRKIYKSSACPACEGTGIDKAKLLCDIDEANEDTAQMEYNFKVAMGNFVDWLDRNGMEVDWYNLAESEKEQ